MIVVLIGSTSSDKYKIRQDTSMQQETQIEEALPLILLYYRFRGQLQPIRNLYCYLELPFIEIHLDYFDQQKQYLSPMILQHIAKLNIFKKELPALIHGNLIVEGLFPIICYTCRRFKREDLFGSSMRIRARQQQIFQNYLLKQPQSMIQLFTLSDKVFKCKTDSEINLITSQLYQKLMSSSKYIKEICQYLDRQLEVGYVFGEITLIDFFFLETCQYMNGLFGRQDRVNSKELANWDPKTGHPLDKPNPYYIEIIKKYKEKMKLQPWYVKHKDYLESFSIINRTITPERVQGLRKIWLGNPKSVA